VQIEGPCEGPIALLGIRMKRMRAVGEEGRGGDKANEKKN